MATSAATAATTKTRAGVGIGSKKDDDATESQDTSTTTHSATETSDVVKDDHHREEGGAAGGGGGGDETAKILLDEAKSYLAEMQSDIQVEIAEDFYTIRLK